jgi:nicotinamide riboside kinase
LECSFHGKEDYPMAIWGEKKAIPAIMGASGITKEQAKTCLYYVIATYFVPDEIELMPILAIIGPQGTGKTELLKQLAKMANSPKWVRGRTFPSLRDKLGRTVTALLDDADDIDEKILINRYSKIDSVIEHKVQLPDKRWVTKKTDVFGATIITKREPFKDSAITSRSIILKTKYKHRDDYKLTKFRNVHEVLIEKAEAIDLKKIGKPTSQRVQNNWMPLQAIASYFKDEEWLEYSKKEIQGSTRVLRAGQHYEPEQALLLVLKEKMKEAMFSTGGMLTDDVLLSEIKNDLRIQFDVNLKNIQIHELLRGYGFKVVSHSGYPKVKFDKELLNKLIKKLL